MTLSVPFSGGSHHVALWSLLIWSASFSVQAIDGATISGATYYEGVTASASLEEQSSSVEALPSAVQLSESTGRVRYELTKDRGNKLDWRVEITNLDRSHEQVDATYQVVLVLPLPGEPSGDPLFTTRTASIKVREGTPKGSVPLIYGGEKVVLKRNVTLERQLLPGLVGPGLSQLPDLTGTGYHYTLWDTLISYDSSYGERVQAFANLRYSTGSSVVGPDADDARLKAYVLTWIPTLDPSVPPFAVRMDVVEAN